MDMFTLSILLQAWFWIMTAISPTPQLMPVPPQTNQFEIAFPSINPDGTVRCTIQYQDCR